MIFSLLMVKTSFIELDLGIELPVACTTLTGNGQEGRYFIFKKRNILHHHGKCSKINLADTKYENRVFQMDTI